jgi:hypothetical protein
MKRAKTFLVLWKTKDDTDWEPNRLYVRAYRHEQVSEMFNKAKRGDVLIDIISLKELNELIDDAKHCARWNGFWPEFDVKHKNCAIKVRK